MQKLYELIKQVYHYEKQGHIETKYLSNILFWFALMVLLVNYLSNSIKTQPEIYVFCICISVLSIWYGILIRRAKKLDFIIKIATIILIFTSIYCIYFGGNDGFQNLWFFMAPFILMIMVGIPFGLPCCIIYGVIITVLFWSPLCHYMSYSYSWDYRIYYPVFYWSFSLLSFIADLFYKKYRIEQEKTELEMENEVLKTIEDAQRLMLNSVTAIGKMIDEKDSYTKEHSKRVADYSLLIAKNIDGLTMTDKELEQIYRSALLHDIGKIAIPDNVLKKPTRLTKDEFEIMKTHPIWGKKILSSLSFLPQADCGAYYHHERFDGKGYPEGKRIDELPYMVRIISAADALDAMNSNRVYRLHCSQEYIINEFIKGSGTQFDPLVSKTVVRLIKEGKIKIFDDKEGDQK